METLCYYAFKSSDPKDGSSRVALKCIANILLLESKTRLIFVQGGNAIKVVKKLNENQEYELLCSRILFLLTYDTAYNFDDLFDNFLLADKIHNIIRHEAEQIDPSSGNNSSSPLGWAPLTETLKLTFNLTSLYPHQISAFNSTLNPILAILKCIKMQTPILQPPLTQLINVLLNLNLLGKEYESAHEHGNNLSFFPNSGPNTHVSRLVAILDSAIRTTSEEILETAAIPLITLLRRAYDLAPSSVKTYMQSTLLPSNDERTQPLGRSDTLASCLLRLSTSPVAPNLREGISSLLFELSDKEATSFVRNVGYGFAAGFLMTHNLPIPDNALKDGKEINPVTGQRRDMEPENLGPEMTEEEKEIEAERLFVLFERLKATGVVNVVNPVQQAVQEGRVEELD
ncbi:guanine nucleotide exchange factor [Usnea florida]